MARREDQLTQVADACRKKGALQTIASRHDLSSVGKGEAIVQECIRELGGVDILICNAGYGVYGAVAEFTPQDMARIWQVNFQSAYESIYAVLPHMLEKKNGHIVLVSSVIGKKAFPYSAPYCATKSALVSLGEALWGELQGTGVGLSVVCPGYTATEFGKAALRAPSMVSLPYTGGGQPPTAVAQAIATAISRHRREVHLTRSGKALLFVNRLFPDLTARLVAWGVERQLADRIRD